MRNFHIRFLTLLVLALAPSLSPAQQLEDYLRIAVENNPGLQAHYLEFEAALEKAAQVASLPDPSISIGAFILPVETRVGPQRLRLSLSQMFPWFGTLAAKESVATEMAQARYQEFIQARNDLFFQVKTVWYQLIELERVIALENQNRALLTTFKDLALSRYQNGKGAMVDVVRVDIMMESSDSEIRLQELKKAPLRTRFNSLLNRSDNPVVQVADTLVRLQLVDGYREDSMLVVHPQLQALDYRLAAMQAQEEAAKKSGMPQFGVGLDYVWVAKRSDANVPGNGRDILMPMVTMGIPIYRKKYRAAVKEAQLKQSAIKATRTNRENQLVGEYEMAWFEVVRADELIASYRARMATVEQVKQLLLIEYSGTGSGFEEVLRMQQELFKYRIAEQKAVVASYIALARLDYLTAKSE